MACLQPPLFYCLVFTSLAGTQERVRQQVLGCRLWEIGCPFHPAVLEGPRDGGPEKDLGRQVRCVPSFHVSIVLKSKFAFLCLAGLALCILRVEAFQNLKCCKF